MGGKREGALEQKEEIERGGRAGLRRVVGSGKGDRWGRNIRGNRTSLSL